MQQNTRVAQEMLAWMRKVDLSPLEPYTTNESSEAHERKNITNIALHIRVYVYMYVISIV